MPDGNRMFKVGPVLLQPVAHQLAAVTILIRVQISLQPLAVSCDDISFTHTANIFFGDISQFVEIKKCAGDACLIDIKRKVPDTGVRVIAAPILVIRVGYIHQIIFYRRQRVTDFNIIAGFGLRIQPLAQFTTRIAVLLQNGTEMNKLRQIKALHLKKLNMYGQ